MPETVLDTFEIKRLDILDARGNADPALMPPLGGAEIKKMYEYLAIARTFDDRALSMQREGRIGTYASIRGQEASQVGSALAFDKKDLIFPSYRESGVFIARDYPLHMLFQFWSGDERGMKVPGDINIFPICISVSTHLPHAAGAAAAAVYKKEKTAVAAYFGDGATSKGDFHEGMNLAGVFNAPAVFICQNNQYAISMPRSRQTAAKTIAQKAVAYGFKGIQVDGNDVFAVYRATKEAVENAKAGGGPTLIECYTYRLSDHTTADDASRYRSREEVEYWLARDPIARLRLYMEKQGLSGGKYEEEVREKAESLVDDGIKKMEETGPAEPQDMFTYTYQGPTARLSAQIRSFSPGAV
ncbi:MAG: pyruvate dehydrogenase (acetyl-transferring) E1 component subunit alpha [Nitrospiraceae bacterium]|nr:pyruvate dehydrogenase (acetyl-transferring) E1 component subunit alpha [Nitrospiraceae bacterium]